MKCKVCKTKFAAKYFLQKTCVEPYCLAKWTKDEREKKADKAFKVKRKKFKLYDVSHQHKLTQVVFNKLRVLQEKKWFADNNQEPQCISCGKENMDWCCGHLKSRGAQSNLRYDVDNTFLQCNRYCNMGLSGNISGNKNTRGYLAGLLERFGEKESQRIIDYCETNTGAVKFTGARLQEMRKEFNKQIKVLQ